MVDNSQVREIGRPVVTAWLEHRSINTLEHGDAADLMERVGAAIEAERVFRHSSAASAAPVVDQGGVLVDREVAANLAFEAVKAALVDENNYSTLQVAAIVAANVRKTPAAAAPVEQKTFKNTKEAMLYAQRNNLPVVTPVSGPAEPLSECCNASVVFSHDGPLCILCGKFTTTKTL